MSAFNHPLRDFLREQRRESGLSLERFAAKYGVNAVTLGSYERGDRVPPTSALAELLAKLGYDLVAVPSGTFLPDADRTPAQWASVLRRLAGVLEESA